MDGNPQPGPLFEQATRPRDAVPLGRSWCSSIGFPAGRPIASAILSGHWDTLCLEPLKVFFPGYFEDMRLVNAFPSPGLPLPRQNFRFLVRNKNGFFVIEISYKVKNEIIVTR